MELFISILGIWIGRNRRPVITSSSAGGTRSLPTTTAVLELLRERLRYGLKFLERFLVDFFMWSLVTIVNCCECLFNISITEEDPLYLILNYLYIYDISRFDCMGSLSILMQVDFVDSVNL